MHRQAMLKAWVRQGRWEVNDPTLGPSLVIGPGRFVIIAVSVVLGLLLVVVLATTYGAIRGDSSWPNAAMGWIALLIFIAWFGFVLVRNAVVIGQHGFRVQGPVPGRPDLEARWPDVRVLRYDPGLFAAYKSVIVCRDSRTGTLVTKHIQTPFIYAAPLSEIIDLLNAKRSERMKAPVRDGRMSG